MNNAAQMLGSEAPALFSNGDCRNMDGSAKSEAFVAVLRFSSSAIFIHCRCEHGDVRWPTVAMSCHCEWKNVFVKCGTCYGRKAYDLMASVFCAVCRSVVWETFLITYLWSHHFVFFTIERFKQLSDFGEIRYECHAIRVSLTLASYCLISCSWL